MMMTEFENKQFLIDKCEETHLRTSSKMRNYKNKKNEFQVN